MQFKLLLVATDKGLQLLLQRLMTKGQSTVIHSFVEIPIFTTFLLPTLPVYLGFGLALRMYFMPNPNGNVIVILLESKLKICLYDALCSLYYFLLNWFTTSIFHIIYCYSLIQQAMDKITEVKITRNEKRAGECQGIIPQLESFRLFNASFDLNPT